MNKNVPHNLEDQEVDLSQISRNIGSFFDWISERIFLGLLFFIKNKIIVSILLVVGIGIGLYLDKTQKNYNHQIIVQPNFGSTDYLYAKINLIESKIEEGDTVFLREIVGIKGSKKINKFGIEPITDVYKFIESKPENFELIKLMAENEDIKKIIENNLTSKNYPFHAISFSTNELISEKESVQPLLNFLNDTDYYKKIQKEILNNIKIKMIQNDTIISQINGVLNGFSNKINGSQKSDKLVYYNENTQLNDVIKTKDGLIIEQGNHRVKLVGLDKIVKDNSITLNVKSTHSVNGKLKLVLPILFIFIFIFIRFFIAFYKKNSLKLQKKR
ncbi:hypothetical protein [Flavobacterium maritimum]|uniref:hypothetical protein n=1 Tax=Flavobacterium maritimum TaxID=3149042 RepID=UPI0032B5C81E